MRFPFSVSLEQINDNDLAKDELIDIRNNQKLLKDFESMELDEFWCKMVQVRVAVPGSRDFGLKSTSRFPGNFSFPSRELNNSSMMLFIQQS